MINEDNVGEFEEQKDNEELLTILAHTVVQLIVARHAKSLKEVLKDLEFECMMIGMKQNHGVKSHAAKMLGISYNNFKTRLRACLGSKENNWRP